MAETKRKLALKLDKSGLLNLYGPGDENLRTAESILGVDLIAVKEMLIIKGGGTESLAARKVFEKLAADAAQGTAISALKIEEVADEVRYSITAPAAKARDNLKYGLFVSPRRDPVRPKTKNQKDYLEKIFSGQITFGIGPAGTGKTYLAAAAGLFLLREKKHDRIILVRPVVEAGESLGFLPGDLKEKINPYLRPLFDAISDMIEPRVFRELLETEIIEIAPLAYMRGRTLRRAFVILDEAQNTTKEQMKMFLTRAGYGTKMVINGDITQTDLPKSVQSGLAHASSILRKTGGVCFADFGAEDVARAPIVREILKAYEKDEKQR